MKDKLDLKTSQAVNALNKTIQDLVNSMHAKAFIDYLKGDEHYRMDLINLLVMGGIHTLCHTMQILTM